MLRDNFHAAAIVSDTSESSFTDSRADLLTMELRLDGFREDLMINDFNVHGKLVLNVWFDEQADEEEQFWVKDITDLSGLSLMHENGNDIPMHMLSVKPSPQEIVDALNRKLEGQEWMRNALREI